MLNHKLPIESNSVKIPIYQSYLKLTGSYELTVLLNQIYFSSKEELDIYDIKRLSFYDKSIPTLRIKLNHLEEIGLITSRKNSLYARKLYKVNTQLYPNNNRLISMLEGVDLIDIPEYITAAIINKFRQHVLHGNDELTFSISSLKKELEADRCVSSISSIISILESNGFLTKKLVGRVYQYKLNSNRLAGYFDKELIDKQSTLLTSLFQNLTTTILTYDKIKSYTSSLRNLLIKGYSYNDLKHIIAYLYKSERYKDRVHSPTHIKNIFSRLKDEASFYISRRKANGVIYSLLNCETPSENVSTCDINKEYNDLSTSKVEAIIAKSSSTLKGWYYRWSYGVSDIDLDDFIQEARILLLLDIKENRDKIDSHLLNSLKFSMQKFMTSKRCTTTNNDIIKFHHEDISDLQDRIASVDQEATNDIYHDNIREYLTELLGKIDSNIADIISDHFGLNEEYKTYSLRELEKKYKCSFTQASRLIKKGLDQLRSHAPPEIISALIN